MPPVGVVFSNTGFGPSLKVGATLIITADSGLSTCSNVAFTGAGAAPTVVSDTEVDVVVPAGASVGPVKITTADGTFDSGYDAFYPLIPLAWQDAPPLTSSRAVLESPPDVDNSTFDGPLGLNKVDMRWDLSLSDTYDTQLDFLCTTCVGRGWDASLAAISESSDDDDTTQLGDSQTASLFYDPDAVEWALLQSCVLFDFNLNNPYSTHLPAYSGDLPPAPVYRSGDPIEAEFEGQDDSPVDYLAWITSIDVNVDVTVGGDIDEVVQVRVVPVDQLEYDTSAPDVSPRQGRWYPGADLSALRVAGDVAVPAGSDNTPATLSFTLDPSEVRLDINHGSHALVIMHPSAQVTHTGSGSAGATFIDLDPVHAVYHYQPPRWRWLIPQYGPSRPTPLRQRQTSTGIHTAGTPLRQRQHHFGLRQRQTGI